MRYIALLRGINVGGQRIIKMTDLKDTLEANGFKNVKTYIQSGNVIFDYEPTDTKKLANQIEMKISQAYGFSVKTITRTQSEFESIINNNPFINEPNIDVDKLHVTFLLEIPRPNLASILDIKKEETEKFLIVSREIYLYLPHGYGNTKLNNSMFEKKLNTNATTRNWKTVNKLLELSKLDLY
jgi:uncharacterized protein (DUF1697 family)